MKSKLIWSILSCVMITILLLNACGGEATEETTTRPSTQTTPTTQTQTTSKYGGVLKIYLSGGVTNFGDPVAPYGSTDANVRTTPIERLFRIFPDDTLRPFLVKSWELGDDGKTFTFHLQQGVKFHDGTDFNAEAVEFNLNRLVTAKNPDVKSIKSIDVVDDYTVRLNLVEYDSALLTSLAYTSGMMISPTAVNTHPTDWLLTNPVGTGPFKFESYEPDQSVKFTKWEGYWQKGEPYLDSVEFLLVADPTSGLMLLKSGEAHSGLVGNPKDAFDLKATGEWDFESIPSNILALVPDSSNTNSPFSDIRVRRALSYAIDKQTIADGLGQGLFSPANQPASPENWYYSQSLKGYPYDPAQAETLLTETDYPNGFSTSLTLRPRDNMDVFTAVQSYLSEIGIDMKLDQATWGKYNETIATGWQNSMVTMNIKISIGQHPSTIASQIFSTSGKQFVSMLHPPEVENLIEQTKTEPSLEKSKDLFSKIYQLIIDEYCLIIPIYVNKGQWMVSTKLHDSQLGLVPGSWTPEITWLSK